MDLSPNLTGGIERRGGGVVTGGEEGEKTEE